MNFNLHTSLKFKNDIELKEKRISKAESLISSRHSSVFKVEAY